jgi:3-phosphoshikimate 1-carboxyvinyltransferase
MPRKIAGAWLSTGLPRLYGEYQGKETAMATRLSITPVTRPVEGTACVPGSKSITNRAQVLAALAEGESRITGALFSDDTRYMAAALNQLGIPVHSDEKACTMTVHGKGGRIPAERADLYVGNAGTAARFLTALVALGHGEYRLDGIHRMRQRPMQDLLDALRMLDVDVAAEMENGCLPLVVRAHGLRGGRTQLRADTSSQYLSALLMVAPYAQSDIEIDVLGHIVSEPYVEMTAWMMRHWGAEVTWDQAGRHFVRAGQHYHACDYHVEPDASSASYFFAAAAVTGGCVRVEGLGRASIQGDAGFVSVLERMGCEIRAGENWLEVRGPKLLHGVEVDMNAMSDAAMTLAAIAPFADGPTHIHNVGHIRHKETDRITAMTNELRKLGVFVEEHADGLRIFPARELQPAEIETYDDHRIAMSFAITGLRSPGITILDPECVGKTFPDFFRCLRRLTQAEQVS